jgi:hypothetical protein
MRLAACLFVAFVCSGALAGEPGQPIDCSDWVSLKPGFVCTVADFGVYYRCSVESLHFAMDNEHHQVAVSVYGNGISILSYGYANGDPEEIGHFLQRGSDSIGFPFGVIYPYGPLVFDEKAGALLIPLRSLGNSYSVNWVATIRGFATTLDVLQSFTPQATLGFRVPYMPEGMAGADHFNTYWGPLAKPLDFAQAHPLACDYPATPPHVGDYLTVADTVPTPAPGQGVYYVTAATYQGATRYGRKTTAGHMAGRDPALLPACAP